MSFEQIILQILRTIFNVYFKQIIYNYLHESTIILNRAIKFRKSKNVRYHKLLLRTKGNKNGEFNSITCGAVLIKKTVVLSSIPLL